MPEFLNNYLHLFYDADNTRWEISYFNAKGIVFAICSLNGPDIFECKTGKWTVNVPHDDVVEFDPEPGMKIVGSGQISDWFGTKKPVVAPTKKPVVAPTKKPVDPTINDGSQCIWTWEVSETQDNLNGEYRKISEKISQYYSDEIWSSSSGSINLVHRIFNPSVYRDKPHIIGFGVGSLSIADYGYCRLSWLTRSIHSEISLCHQEWRKRNQVPQPRFESKCEQQPSDQTNKFEVKHTVDPAVNMMKVVVVECDEMGGDQTVEEFDEKKRSEFIRYCDANGCTVSDYESVSVPNCKALHGPRRLAEGQSRAATATLEVAKEKADDLAAGICEDLGESECAASAPEDESTPASSDGPQIAIIVGAVVGVIGVLGFI